MGRELTLLTESQALQIQIETVQFTPATITFNVDQISQVLDAQLAKYKGLTFTEDTESDAKKVIAELRKGKALLETYRKTTKADLTVAVTEFEQQIKELANKFDLVINPLTEQTAQFETNRRAEKTVAIAGIISALIIKYQLQGAFADKLIAPESYLNRTTTMNSISTELGMEAESLKADQDRHESELTLVRSSVEFANQSLSGAGLLEYTYTRLLGPLTLVEVLSRLNTDVAAMKAREEANAAREAAVAMASAEAVVLQQTVVETIIKPSSVMGIQRSDVEAASQPSNTITKTYRIAATSGEHDELEVFLNDSIYNWEVS